MRATMTKKAPSFKSTATALLMPWLLVQVAQAVGQAPEDISARDSLDPGGCQQDTGAGCGEPHRPAPEPSGSTGSTSSSIDSTDTRVSPSGNLQLSSPDGSSQPIVSPQMTGSTTGSTTGSAVRSGGGPKNVPAIVGGVVGGVAFLALLGALLFFFLRRRSDSDTEGNYQSVVVLDKSRASSPTSMSAAYGGAPPPPVAAPLPSGSPPPPPPPALLHSAPGPSAPALAAGYSDRGIMLDPPPPQPLQLQQQPQAAPAPQQIAAPPAELHSREVDEDGVSVSSLDLHRPVESRSVPRLPVYQRQTPPGSGTIGRL